MINDLQQLIALKHAENTQTGRELQGNKKYEGNKSKVIMQDWALTLKISECLALPFKPIDLMIN